MCICNSCKNHISDMWDITSLISHLPGIYSIHTHCSAVTTVHISLSVVLIRPRKGLKEDPYTPWESLCEASEVPRASLKFSAGYNRSCVTLRGSIKEAARSLNQLKQSHTNY